MQREHASGRRTVQLDTGQKLIIPFKLARTKRYAFTIRYSNDNDNTMPSETLRVRLDGKTLGRFTARDTGNRGFGWDVFRKSRAFGPKALKSGRHKLLLAVSGGDGYGIEIDNVALRRR